MGEVYRAHDPRLHRDVALKVLLPEFAADADRLQRFVREAHTLAALNHPNIAQIHGVEDGPIGAAGQAVRALVMEFVEGEDLSARIARGPVPIDECLDIARQIAEALEAAHDQGVVHRDLKPANIKIRGDGAVKVLDFGLAKGTAAPAPSASSASSPTLTSPALTSANVILGTAAYMSPEQARGKFVDKRSDVWSFGVVLYEMLTGRPAYRGETVTDLIAAVVKSDPDWSALPDDVPASIRRLLHRCLDKDPRMRLRDIGEARITLANPEATDRSPIARTPGDERSRAAARFLPWTIAALSIGAAAMAWFTRPALEAPVRKLELAIPAEASTPTVTLSPDGRHIAFRAGDRITVRDLARLQSMNLVISPPSQRNTLFWSHDSQFLGYNDAEAKLWIVPALGGTPRLVTTIPETGQLMGATWNRKNVITFAVWRGGLYQVSAVGGDPTQLLGVDRAKEIDFHLPVELPDGRILVGTHLVQAAPGGEPFRIEAISAQRREPVLTGGFVPVGFVSGHVLLDRFDANSGLWAVPFSDQLPLRVEDGFLVGPGASYTTTAADGSVLYSLPPDAPEMRELVWTDREGRVLSSIAAAYVDLESPSMSSDQRRIAFSARTRDNVDIWVHDLQRQIATRVTTDAIQQGWPSWFPSGDRIAYWELGAVGSSRIAISRADGSGGRQEVANGASPEVTPDGAHVLYVVDDRGDTHVRVATISPQGEASNGTPLLKRAPEPSVHGMDFSPDGRFLAYAERAPGGSLELFMTSFPSGDGRWPVASGGARSPVWRSAGELLFIAGSSEGPYTMMSASIGTGNPPRIGSPIKLFEIPPEIRVAPRGLSFDATTDGKRFVLVRSQAGSRAAARWVLVQNWLSEFRQ